MNFTISETTQVGERLLGIVQEKASSEHATLITFSGDLGAGKTTLIQELAKQLGVVETLQSPTYVIYKSYDTHTNLPWKKLIHADLYRLESEEEMSHLGFQELLADPENLLCVEWPERAPAALGAPEIRVVLTHKGIDNRDIDIV